MAAFFPIALWFQCGFARYKQMEDNKWKKRKKSGSISTFVSFQETQYRFHGRGICTAPVEHDDEGDVYGG